MTTDSFNPEALPPRRRSLRLVVIVAVLLFTLAGVLLLLGDPVRGTIRLGTPGDEPKLNLFVGGQLVGQNRAEVSWSEIFGWGGKTPLGIILPNDAEGVSRDGTSLGAVTAERLGGPGATLLSYSPGNPMSMSAHSKHDFAYWEIILRRPDGSIDQVFCMDARLSDLFGKPYRALVPIRVRSPLKETDRCYTSEAHGTDSGRFNNVLNNVTREWRFERKEWPPELIAEIEQNGLWRPSP